MQGDPEDAEAPGRVLDHGQDVGLGAVEQVDREESRARIASAWDRRNCDQVGPARRMPGLMPPKGSSITGSDSMLADSSGRWP
jgi:hypothetical protein